MGLYREKGFARGRYRVVLDDNQQVCHIMSENLVLSEVAAPTKQRAQAEVEEPNDFRCPIIRDLMTNPVVTADGQSYERAAIEEWLQAHNTSPMTNLPLANETLIPNIQLRCTIEAWKARRDAQPDPQVVLGAPPGAQPNDAGDALPPVSHQRARPPRFFKGRSLVFRRRLDEED